MNFGMSKMPALSLKLQQNCFAILPIWRLSLIIPVPCPSLESKFQQFLNDKSCATSMSSNNYAVQRHSKTSQNMLSTQKLIKELIIHLCHKRISNPVDKDSRLACLWNNFKFLNCNWREFERFWRLCLKECRVIDFLCKSDEI